MKFNEKYNQENFLTFSENFLPEDFVVREEDILIKKDRYKEITKAKVLGFCKSLDLHVLEMDHTRENDPRITIATDAFKILADHWIHRALVVFKNDNGENYRFSYLTITLDLNDKNKVTKRYSNARRYSFYLGPQAKVKTPQQQLVKKGKIKDIEDLLSRFSVEVVNKEFYFEVANFFDELVSSEGENLLLPGVSHDDVNTRKSFAVRLIGRIMFCWFLKQKKSDKGQLIPDELLSSKVVLDNYYHSILEPLFFGVLNTSVDSRDIRSELFDRVPYLNGGLFNPQTDDYYELDRGTFASKYINTLKVSDSWFKDFFDLLETYNFTIDENTVFDQELSVDPEMLGRIFENLLAEINPDTGSSERKRTGSFYTPRSIVEYMVDQSLIEHFKTKTKINEKKLSALVSYDLSDDVEYPLDGDEKQKIIDAIESLRILDPACGSGAYPIGALQKIVYILQQIDPSCNLWLEKRLKGVPDLYKQKIMNDSKSKPFDYIRKLDVIKNSIFGVDIQPIAVDVSRLRCFLTLVVESEIDDTKQNRGIDPLPNLDFKFVCANTLVPSPEKDVLNEGSLFADDFQDRLAVAVDRYFSSSGENKRSANNEIHKLIDSKIDEKLKYLNGLVFFNGDKKMESLRAQSNKKQISQHSRILVLWSTYKNIFENKPVGFFDPKYFFPSIKDGFDIVIGNPPYVSTKGADDTFKKDLEDSFGFFDDLYSHFYFKGFELCKDLGVLSYITSKTFWTIQTKKNLRELLLRNNIIAIYDTVNPFESAMVDTCVVSVQKSTKQENNILFLKAERDYLNPSKKEVSKSLFTNAVNNVIFEPSIENITIYDKYNSTVSDLMKKYWLMINTSKNITKYDKQIQEHKDNLKPGDITLLGLVTDGGQGLATSNNGKYIGVLSTTKEAVKIKETRVIKFFDFVSKMKITEYGDSKESIGVYLSKLSEKEIYSLFETLKNKHGRDIFGQGYLYRIVNLDEVKNVEEMSEEEKRMGLMGDRTFVPYDKGDKDGNRWYLRTPYYINWSRENIDFLKSDPNARYQGHQFFFRAGFCWINVLNPSARLIKTRQKEKSVNDVGSMSLYSMFDKISDKYCVCLLNSNFLFDFYRTFINFSVNVQINDLRQLPIIIPTPEELSAFENLFDRAFEIKVKQFNGVITNLEAEQYLQEIQEELDKKVSKIYGLGEISYQ